MELKNVWYSKTKCTHIHEFVRVCRQKTKIFAIDILNLPFHIAIIMELYICLNHLEFYIIFGKQ